MSQNGPSGVYSPARVCVPSWLTDSKQGGIILPGSRFRGERLR
jgi:hypothetical protein